MLRAEQDRARFDEPDPVGSAEDRLDRLRVLQDALRLKRGA